MDNISAFGIDHGAEVSKGLAQLTQKAGRRMATNANLKAISRGGGNKVTRMQGSLGSGVARAGGAMRVNRGARTTSRLTQGSGAA